MKHPCRVTNGKIYFDNRDAFVIARSKLEGKECTLELIKKSNKRSNNQNRYLFGVCLKLIAEHLGYQDNDVESLWNTVKIEIGFCDEIEIHGKRFVVARPSRKLSTVEFEELASLLRTWASAELKLYLPLPNEDGLF